MISRNHTVTLHTFAISAFATLVLLTGSGCSKHASAPQPDEYLSVQGNTIAPGTIVQVDSYPLFVMNFDGEYESPGSPSVTTGQQKDSALIQRTSTQSWGCTCFSVMGDMQNVLFGRNFDYFHHCALILYTHPLRGYASLSTVDLFYLGFSEQSTLEIIRRSSALRSAPSLPFDGMNERGVAIGQMAVETAEPPYDPHKINLSCLEIIRLVLDNASTTREAVALMEDYNYLVGDPPVHFLIGDRTGTSAVVEYVDGEMKVLYNTEPFQVCTNFIVAGSNAPSSAPCWRYNKAYGTLKASAGKLSADSTMNLLQSVSQSITMWSIVFSQSSFSMKIAIDRKYDTPYTVDAP